MWGCWKLGAFFRSSINYKCLFKPESFTQNTGNQLWRQINQYNITKVLRKFTWRTFLLQRQVSRCKKDTLQGLWGLLWRMGKYPPWYWKVLMAKGRNKWRSRKSWSTLWWRQRWLHQMHATDVLEFGPDRITTRLMQLRAMMTPKFKFKRGTKPPRAFNQATGDLPVHGKTTRE